MQQLLPNSLLQGGRYKIDRVLGQGGFGITYLATHEPFGTKVAIKEFFMSGVNGRKRDKQSVSVSLATNKNVFECQRTKFKKEALRIHEIHNEHIVEVRDYFEENGTSYFTMDFVEGETLDARLRSNGCPIEEQEVKHVFIQMLDALSAIHNQGFYHLDIKPANIMVDKKGVVKLIDFGASKQQESDGGITITSAVCFSNGFAPIEQMSNPPCLANFGPWTDFYALGATMFQLLTNRMPPSYTDIMEDESKDKHLAFPMPGVSLAMKNLVIWMTQIARSKRPQSIAELRDYCQSNLGEIIKKPKRKIKKTSQSKKKESTHNDEMTKVILGQTVKEEKTAKALIGKWHMCRFLGTVILDIDTEYRDDGTFLSEGGFVFVIVLEDEEVGIFSERFSEEGTWYIKEDQLKEKTNSFKTSGLLLYPDINISHQNLSKRERKQLDDFEDQLWGSETTEESSSVIRSNGTDYICLKDDWGEFCMERIDRPNRYMIKLDGVLCPLSYSLEDIWEMGLFTQCCNNVEIRNLDGVSNFRHISKYPFYRFERTVSKGIGHIESDDEGNLKIVCFEQSEDPCAFQIGQYGKIVKVAQQQSHKSFWRKLFE